MFSTVLFYPTTLDGNFKVGYVKKVSFIDKEAIRWIITQKGDTDTNACIMGGLLGAYYGLTKLERDPQIAKIKAWNSKRRPEWLNPGKVIPQSV